MAATINRLLLAAVGAVAYVDVSLGLTVGPKPINNCNPPVVLCKAWEPLFNACDGSPAWASHGRPQELSSPPTRR